MAICLLNDEQMSNWLGVEHLPIILVERNLYLNPFLL